jgi:hypothetical protein
MKKWGERYPGRTLPSRRDDQSHGLLQKAQGMQVEVQNIKCYKYWQQLNKIKKYL